MDGFWNWWNQRLTNDADFGPVTITNIDNPAPKIGLGNKTLAGLLTGGGFSLLNLVFVFVGLAFFATLIMAGWDYLGSSGDSKKIAVASTRITNALIGLVISFTAFLLVNLVTNMIGLGSQF